MHDNRVTRVTILSPSEAVQTRRKRRSKVSDQKIKQRKAQRRARKVNR